MCLLLNSCEKSSLSPRMLLAFYLLFQIENVRPLHAWAERRWLQLSPSGEMSHGWLLTRADSFCPWRGDKEDENTWLPRTCHQSWLERVPFLRVSRQAGVPGLRAQCDTEEGSRRAAGDLRFVCVGALPPRRHLTGPALALAAHEAVMCPSAALPPWPAVGSRVCSGSPPPSHLGASSVSPHRCPVGPRHPTHPVLICPLPLKPQTSFPFWGWCGVSAGLRARLQPRLLPAFPCMVDIYIAGDSQEDAP